MGRNFIWCSTSIYPRSHTFYTAQKVKFSMKHFFSKFDQIRSLLRRILNGKLHFLCSVNIFPCDQFLFSKNKDVAPVMLTT